MRTNDEIKRLIKDAFQPVECVIEIQDYNSKIGVAVYPPNKDRVIPIHQEPLSKLREGDAIFQILRDSRRRIKLFGVELDPWANDDP